MHDEYRFHDLLDDDGAFLGCVRESITNRQYATFNSNDHIPMGKYDSLDEAKGVLIAHLVKGRLDDL